MATEGNTEVLTRARHVKEEIEKGKIGVFALSVNDGRYKQIGYATGNGACLDLINKTIAEMERGAISSFVYSLNDQIRNGIDWIGIQGHPEYQMIAGCAALYDRIIRGQTTNGLEPLDTGSDMALAGLFELMIRINRQMWDRHPAGKAMELSEGVDPSSVVYHHPQVTIGYDFLPWILAREMDRVRLGAEPLKVWFVASKPLSAKDQQMAEGVCIPLIKMIGAEMATGKPPSNALWYPTNCMEEVVELMKEGNPVPTLEPAPWALEAMASYKGVVTITLREASHWEARNSVEEDWREIAYRLRDKGETVVIVRDTAKADEPFHGFLTVPHASKDLQCRAALYRLAKCNLFVANGPSNIDWFCGDTPSLAFTPMEDSEGIPESASGIREYKCSQRAWWKPNNGIDPYVEEYPFFKGKKKKLVLAWPSVERVLKEYDELMNGDKQRGLPELANAVSGSVHRPPEHGVVGRDAKANGRRGRKRNAKGLRSKDAVGNGAAQHGLSGSSQPANEPGKSAG